MMSSPRKRFSIVNALVSLAAAVVLVGCVTSSVATAQVIQRELGSQPSGKKTSDHDPVKLVIQNVTQDPRAERDADDARSAKRQLNTTEQKTSDQNDAADGNRVSKTQQDREDPSGWLSRKSYSSRQQATLQMWRDRDRSREQVQQAARDPDPEVSGRAKWILRQWRRGSMPDTPPEIFRLLQQSNGPLAIERLLEGGQIDAALVAVEESAGTADFEAIQTRISSAMMRRFPLYVHHAIANGTLPALLKLVDLVATTKELAVTRVALMRRLGIPLDRDALLPRSAGGWSQQQRREATTLVLLCLGETDQALAFAHAGDVEDDLVRHCRFLSGRWAEQAQRDWTLAQQAAPGTYEHTRTWVLAMIAADRASDQALFEQAVNVLSEIASPANVDLASELRWRALASHGSIDAAVDVVKASHPEIAANVMLAASRAEEAMGLLGYSLDRMGTDLDQWINQALNAQKATNTTSFAPELLRVMALMQCLISVGDDAPAWTIAKRVCNSGVKIGTFDLRILVLSNLLQSRRAEWITSLAVGDGDTTMDQRVRELVAMTVPDGDDQSFETVLRAMSTILRDQPLRRRIRATVQLFQGDIPQGFDPESDFRRLFQYVAMPRATQRGGQIGLFGVRANLKIVDLLMRHGQVNLAEDCLTLLVDAGDINALFRQAEIEMNRGRSERAAQGFEEVFRRIENQGRDAGRLGTSDDAALAVKALVGLWTIARRNGDDETAGQLIEEIHLALCTPSLNTRFAVAEYLGQSGETSLATDLFEPLLPMTLLGTPERTRLYDVARTFSLQVHEDDPSKAADWFDLALVGTLESMDFQPRGYVTLPLYVHRWRVEAAIADRDVDQVRRHRDRILQLDPIDVDFAERLLPVMRDADMDEIADETFERIMDAGLRYARRFAFDSMTSNNLAWAAAMNQRRLEDALELSRMAVFVEPESYIYRDTLAEVLYLMGRHRQALLIEQACLLDQPDDWHLHEQIKKYAAAADDSPPSDSAGQNP